MNRRNVNKSFGRGGVALVLFAEAATPSQPSEGAFDDPAAGEHHKPLLIG